MIKVVSFDLWNTLLTGANSETSERQRGDKIREVLLKEGFTVTTDEINSAVKKAWDYFNEEWLGKYYTLQTSASLDVIFSELKINPSSSLRKEILEIMQKSLMKSENKIIEGMKELVLSLRKDYILAIISDAGFTPGRYLREVIRELELHDSFSVYAFSDEIGVSKPHRKIFEYVLMSTGAQPHETVHIGDIPVTDIKGANDMGMYSVHFSKETYLFKDSDKIKPSFSTDSPEEIGKFIKEIREKL
ncbi:MAG: HAD family hydrolase [bacterium]|nr:HAD family hydrolase [bacterium]